MAMLLSLPDEILLMILWNLYYVDNDFRQYGEKKDILSSRLVCTILANIGQEVAFRHIEFLQDETGVKRLLELSRSPLCKEVRRLTCSFEVFDTEIASNPEVFTAQLQLRDYRLDQFEWLEYRRRRRDLPEHILSELTEMFEESRREYQDLLGRDSLRINDLFEEYRRGSQYQDLLEHSGLGESLAIALRQFQNVCAVRISQSWAHPWYENLYDDELEPISASPTGKRFFEAITDALAMNGIEDLMLGYFDSDSPSYTASPPPLGIIQGLAPVRLEEYRRAFRKLTRLKVALPWIVFGEDRRADGLEFRGLSALIRSAVLLEELCLSFDERSSYPLPSSFLCSLETPHLRALTLNSAMFDSSSLLTFLGRHAATLKSLHFCSVILRRGCWEMVCSGMRDLLTLESSIMDGFYTYNDTEESDEEICPSQDDLNPLFYRAVDEFIQRKTEVNPFELLRPPAS